MKPVRGSGRAGTKAPRGKKPPLSTNKKTDPKQNDPLKPGTSNQNKKQEGRRIKGQENWKPMPKASITPLGELLDISILSLLTETRMKKEETQKHLNKLKKKFLASCETLPVPAQKRGGVVYTSRRHQEESKKETVLKDTLAQLKEDLGDVVRSLEDMEERSESLDHECNQLRRQLEEAEENALEVLQMQMSQSEELNLPPYKDSKPTQQGYSDQLLDLVPVVKRNRRVARRVGAVLKNMN